MFYSVRAFFLVLSILFSFAGCEKKSRNSIAISEQEVSQDSEASENCFFAWKHYGDESGMHMRLLCIKDASVREYVSQRASDKGFVCNHPSFKGLDGEASFE